jgi:hypothetical protein
MKYDLRLIPADRVEGGNEKGGSTLYGSGAGVINITPTKEAGKKAIRNGL